MEQIPTLAIVWIRDLKEHIVKVRQYVTFILCEYCPCRKKGVLIYKKIQNPSEIISLC